jgi:hypothetical protein
MSAHKLPPKGSFSAVYSSNPVSRTPEPKINPKNQHSPSFSTPDFDSFTNSEFNDMYQDAQIALKELCQVQEDTAKLFTLWEISEKENIGLLWEFLQKVLQENGFKPLGNKPNLKKLSKVILDMIAELKVLRQTLGTDKFDSQNLNANSNFVEESYSRESTEDINYYKEYIKSLEDQISLIKSKVNEFHELSLIQLQKDNKVLKEIQLVVEAEKEEEILSKVISYKKIMNIVPSLEIFVEEVCKEFVPEIVEEHDYQSYSVALKQIFPRIKTLKESLESLSSFKNNVYQSLKAGLDTPESEILEKIDSVNFFQKLFDVGQDEDLLGVMEKLFLYLWESKNILEYIKIKLRIDPSASGSYLCEEIKKNL